MTTITATAPSSAAVFVPQAARRPATPAAGWAFTASDLLRVIRQRIFLVIFLWLFFIGLAIGGTALWIQRYPSFRAEALVKVESLQPQDATENQKMNRADVEAMEMLVKDQAVFVKSTVVLTDALEDPEVKKTGWYNELIARNDPQLDVIEELGDIVDAAPIPETSYLLVSIAERIPGDLPTIVNTIVDKYVQRVNDISKSHYRAEYERMNKEVGLAKNELAQKTRDIDAFREQTPGAVLGTSGPNVIGEELMTLKSLVTELEMAMLGRKQIFENYRQVTPEELPITAEVQAALQADPDLANLRLGIDQLSGETEVAQRSLGAKHRQTLQLARRLEMLKERLAQMEWQKLNELKVLQIEQARADYAQAQGQLNELMDRYIAVETKQRDLDRRALQYVQLLDEREFLKVNYEALLQQRDQLNMILRQDRTVRIEIASKAIVPKVRAVPKWEINIPIGAIVGLMLSVGVAVLLELADTSVRTARDVVRHAALPVLATIPALDDEEVEIERVELAAVDAPHSLIAEAFRQLRTNLFFSAPVEHQSTILITSPGAEDGKTAVSVNLAAAVAVSGRRVLLIDANFRRPALHALFPNTRPEGLSNLLIGQSRLADLVTPSGIPGLDILTTGPMPPNPAELLGSNHLREMLADARSQYDQIILDGPPVLLVSDALVLSGALDGAVLVCRFRNTSRGALIRAKAQLEAINARILGAVLNAVQTTRGGYYRKAYRAFYDYRTEEGAERPRLGTKETPTVPNEESAKAISDDLAALEGKPDDSPGASPDEKDTA